MKPVPPLCELCVGGGWGLTQTAKTVYKREALKYKKSDNLSKERRKQLKEAALDAKRKYQAAQDKFDNFPSRLDFVNFPIPDEYVLSDDITEGLCREIEAKIRRGKVGCVYASALAWGD